MTPRHHLTDPPTRTLEIGPLQKIGRLEAQIARLQRLAVKAQTGSMMEYYEARAECDKHGDLDPQEQAG